MERDPRVGLVAGDGVVVRVDDTIVVLDGGPATSTELIERVVATVGARVGDDLVRELARVALAVDEPPALAVATFGDEAVSVFLHGAIDLHTPTGRVSGVDHVLGVTATVDPSAGFTIAVSDLQDVAVASWSHLGAGTVAGAGVVVTPAEPSHDGRWSPPAPSAAADPAESEPVDPAESEPVDPAESEPVDPAESEPVDPADSEPAADAPFEAISLDVGSDLSDRRPLPIADAAGDDEDDLPAYERPVMVIGVRSPKGFFNHPDAKYCSRTGVKMGASRTSVLTEGPRPPLGVVTLDDGSTLTVRWNTVIGRDPHVDEMVRAGTAAPFVVSDIAQSVSRRHALLELVDWDVLISDLGSRNSTYLQTGPDAPLRRLAVGERVVLHSGTIVHLGKRSFVYHEHHVR